ncbi:MAG: methyltransferase domain-containing protein [Nitrospiria bacterium]
MPTGNNEPYPHIGRVEEEVDAAFWEARYRNGDTGWDQGAASPGLIDLLQSGQIQSGNVLVPGCGRGHEARELARAGFEVTGMDITEGAIREATSLAEREGLQKIKFVQADFFNLPDKGFGPYDWIFEHTFFCAINPRLREDYVLAVARLIKPGGSLIGMFYHIQTESGPPFGCTRDELVERFSPQFTLRLEKTPRSFPDRDGKELLMLWERK